MNITIHHKDSNDTSIISIPESAKVDTSTGKSTCRNITANEDQDLVLNWKEDGMVYDERMKKNSENQDEKKPSLSLNR